MAAVSSRTNLSGPVLVSSPQAHAHHSAMHHPHHHSVGVSGGSGSSGANNSINSLMMDTASKRAMNDLFLSWMSRPDTEAIIHRALMPFQSTPNSMSTSAPSTPLLHPHQHPTTSSTNTPPSSSALNISNNQSDAVSPSLTSIATASMSMPMLSLLSIESSSSSGSSTGTPNPNNGLSPASPKSARARLLDLANIGMTPYTSASDATSPSSTASTLSSSTASTTTTITGTGRPKTPISVVITSVPESLTPPGSADSSHGHVRRASSPLLAHLPISSEPHSPIDGEHRPSTPISPGSNHTPRRAPPSPHRLDINRITASPPRSPLVRGRSPIPSPDSKRKPSIGQFYFPGGMPLSPTSERRDLDMISKLFTRTATQKDREDAKKAAAAASSSNSSSVSVLSSTASTSTTSAPSTSSTTAFSFSLPSDSTSSSNTAHNASGSSRSISSTSPPQSAHAGLSEEELYPVCSLVCGLSSYCNAALYSKILQFNNIPYDPATAAQPVAGAPGTPPMPPPKPLITEAMFLKYWKAELAKRDVATRFFRLLRQSPQSLPGSIIRPVTPGGGLGSLSGPPRSYLTRDDFRPIVQEIVNRHPGLEFLEATPEFQLRYAQTVIARIFYAVNKSGNEQLTLREIKNSNLMAMLQLLDEEDDINKINDYFSYEHFYVIYCKFWELDTDHDGLLDKNDLLKYDDFSLTPSVVDRVLEGAGRRLLSGVPAKMSYADFLVFLISEVDKASDVGLEYWFRVLDLDGDGILATFELEYFFNQQKTRMQALSQEPVRFPDILCQLTDMIKPDVDGQFTKRDLKRSLMAPLFFNTLFNLNKYIIAEQRDPVRIRQVHATPELSDWDRYAIAGYYRLAECEPEQQQQAGGAALDNAELDAWNQSAAHQQRLEQSILGGAGAGGAVVAGSVVMTATTSGSGSVVTVGGAVGASRAGHHGSIGGSATHTRVADEDIDDGTEHDGEADSDDDGALFLGVGAAEAPSSRK